MTPSMTEKVLMDETTEPAPTLVASPPVTP